MNIDNLRKNILKRSFYTQDTFVCLKESLGKILVHEEGKNTTAGRIVEVEAYIGGEDKGSHAYQNRRTKRTEIQFNDGGYAYVYRSHMYDLLNFVTEEKDIPKVILIRALEPLYGLDIMKERRGKDDVISLTNGPGKLSQAMNITKELYGHDMTKSNSKLFLIDDGFKINDEDIVKTARIGIDYAEDYKDVPWRWYLKDSMFVSRR
ncbi:MAG: DNA-3-methyladenine glycosylase [Candidatus Dojkabacteria bacterium]|jgi:DNA-3-methyladenine glycosylase